MHSGSPCLLGEPELMTEPKQYYASTRYPWFILAAGIGFVFLALYDEMEGAGSATGLILISLLAMVAPWIIWKRRQRPMLIIESDALRINTLTDAGEEHLLPFSKIASIYITKVDQDTLNMFEYDIPWPLNRNKRYGQKPVDAIVIETTDGRQVPRIPVAMFRGGQRKEIRAWVGDIQPKIGVALPKEIQREGPQVPAESPLGIAMGELRATVLSNYAEQVVIAIPGADDSGRSVSIAPVTLWNFEGSLTADFDSQDRLCSITWDSDPSNHITEAMTRQLLDSLEVLFGQSDGQRNRLGWKRRDGDVVRELGVEGENAPYSLWYTEHSV
jgi:hypothetical protein